MMNVQKKHVNLLERNATSENQCSTATPSMIATSASMAYTIFSPVQNMRYIEREFRGQRVGQLKAQVEAGKYQIDSYRLAHTLWHSTAPNHLLKFNPDIVMDES
ncbi:flagellar biosynthesis anti-sigma factor FlgM [Dictyobacter arantiisoli]|uniref:Anti-sigma-28 factor FlgM C-terminal domain-containing protein n=1 Tax=Dictyobacter arantiisoli TaxID=2014874 RepID=A0A5A5T939_9CHLR|nr:flagellar biosynthesis anti-sigma factor FlgM [Dictyobacter arantiisoli]GCF07785.1 hypothetical protein KDI_13490 [Dictyobacter arantiisoli]